MLSNIVDVGIAKKQNYSTPGGRCSRRGLKTVENLKTLMLNNGCCRSWRQSFTRVSNHKALTRKSVVV